MSRVVVIQRFDPQARAATCEFVTLAVGGSSEELETFGDAWRADAALFCHPLVLAATTPRGSAFARQDGLENGGCSGCWVEDVPSFASGDAEAGLFAACALALRRAVFPAWPSVGVHVVRIPKGRGEEGCDVVVRWSESAAIPRLASVLAERPDVALASWDQAPTPLERGELDGATARALREGWGVPESELSGWKDALSERWIDGFCRTKREWPAGSVNSGQISRKISQAWSAVSCWPNAEVHLVARGLVCHAPPPDFRAFTVRTRVLDHAILALEQQQQRPSFSALPRVCAALAWLAPERSVCSGPLGTLRRHSQTPPPPPPEEEPNNGVGVRFVYAAHLAAANSEKEERTTAWCRLEHNLPVLAETAERCARILASASVRGTMPSEIRVEVSFFGAEGEKGAPSSEELEARLRLLVGRQPRRSELLLPLRARVVRNDVVGRDFTKWADALEEETPGSPALLTVLANDSFVLRRPFADLVASFPFSAEPSSPAAFHGLAGCFFLRPHSQSYARVLNAAACNQLIEAVRAFRSAAGAAAGDGKVLDDAAPVIQALEVGAPGGCPLWSAHYVPELKAHDPSEMPEPAFNIWTTRPLIERANFPLVKSKLSAFGPHGASLHLEKHAWPDATTREHRRWLAMPAPLALIRSLNDDEAEEEEEGKGRLLPFKARFLRWKGPDPATLVGAAPSRPTAERRKEGPGWRQRMLEEGHELQRLTRQRDWNQPFDFLSERLPIGALLTLGEIDHTLAPLAAPPVSRAASLGRKNLLRGHDKG